MKVLFSVVLTISSVSAWNGSVKPSNMAVVPSNTAKHAVAIPLDQPVPSPSEKQIVDSEHAWVAKLDYEGFHKEVNELGKQLLKDTGDADVEHLEKIMKWRDVAAALGVLTMWMAPNPITVAALSTWTYASWTMIAHHVCHGGYSSSRVNTSKYNSGGFALGSVFKRVQDWCDWMAPEAWNVEHNRLHHYHLGELKDPDLVQRNLEFLRKMDIEIWKKYVAVGLLMPIWKWSYYAPNTYKELQITKYKRENGGELPPDFAPMEALTVGAIVNPATQSQVAAREIVKPLDFFINVLGPFLFSRFLLLPMPLLLLPGVGPAFFGHAVLNLIFADMLTNIHGFITIVTNHAGKDVYTFNDEVKPKSGAFYVRQVVGSVNYATGSDPVDFAHVRTHRLLNATPVVSESYE